MDCLVKMVLKGFGFETKDHQIEVLDFIAWFQIRCLIKLLLA